MWFVAQLSELYRILDYVRRQAEHAGLDRKTLNRLELVCEEAIVNVMRYAFPNHKGEIGVFCETYPDRFDVILRDRGIPFNPTHAMSDHVTTEIATDPPIGGVGLCLIRRLIDNVTYHWDGNENVLRLSIHKGR